MKDNQLDYQVITQIGFESLEAVRNPDRENFHVR